MANPFKKRATEYLRDDNAFLSVVTPDPLFEYFEKEAKEDRLFDRLVTVLGTPGSGKTTIAMLLQFRMAETLRKYPDRDDFKALVSALNKCRVMKAGTAIVLGCRLPLEAEYREFWELPYKEGLKIGLVEALIQARAVISWFRNITAGGRYSLSEISIIPREGADAAIQEIGGVSAEEVFLKAQKVESALYEIGASLVPPPIEKLKPDATGAYRPFDVIEKIQIDQGPEKPPRILQPLVILDDAHTLHPHQFIYMQAWLARREMKVARWVMTRLDSETETETLNEGNEPTSDMSGAHFIKPDREITRIRLQADRRNSRSNFRKMANAMSDRYLGLMDTFRRQGIRNFKDILSLQPEFLSPSKINELSKKVDRFLRQFNIPTQRVKELESEVVSYLANASPLDKGDDLKLAMLLILLNRYTKRVRQTSLFDSEEDQSPSRPLVANAGVSEGARIHLLHEFNRPYFYGFDKLCDASSQNAEIFLQLAGELVSASETRLIRSSSSAALSAAYQNRLLRDKAKKVIEEWSFRDYRAVQRLVKGIAHQCIQRSLEPNAPLGGGANAFGILQEEFKTIVEKCPELAQALKYGVAYNALVLVPGYGTKKKKWCLIELGGVPLIAYGLTFSRGGFLERRVADLEMLLKEEP